MAGESAREVARRAREQASRLERRAAMFEKGADGEAATAMVLAALPPGWTALHDVRWPQRRLANIDHIVLGPGGIFVIDSKNWSGRLEVKGSRLRQNGRSREAAVAGCADAGLAIAELLGPHAAKVFPILCFVRDDDLRGWCRDVMVCSTGTLTGMLLSRPAILTPDESMEAWFRLDTQLRAAAQQNTAGYQLPGTPPAPHGRARHRPQPRPAQSRRSTRRQQGRSARRRRALVHAVTSLALLAGVVAYGPQLSMAAGERLAELFTSSLTPATACDGQPTAGAQVEQRREGAQSRPEARERRQERRSDRRQQTEGVPGAGPADC